MTRTQQLAEELAKLLTPEIIAKIKALPTKGPRGGNNAKTIPGWSHSPNGTISYACNKAGIPTMKFWSGSAPTPSTAIPTCLASVAQALYNKIFTEVSK